MNPFRFWLIAVLMIFSFSEAQSLSGQWISDTFENASGPKKFQLYLPRGFEALQDYPVIVGLHGCMQSVQDFVGVTGLQQLADQEKVVLLLPEQNLSSNPNLCWNWYAASNQRRGQGEPAQIIGMIEKIKIKFQGKPKNIFIFGVSAGAGLTSNLLATYPEIFSAGMVASGVMFKAATSATDLFTVSQFGSANNPEQTISDQWNLLPTPLKILHPVPLMIIHGDQDLICDSINSEQILRQFLRFNDLLDDGSNNQSFPHGSMDAGFLRSRGGVDYSWKIYGVSPFKPVVLTYLIHGMGHEWSGGDARYPFHFSRGPDATLLMWNFFKKQF